MRYLLDTHVILWYAQGSSELAGAVRKIIAHEECCFSVASLWEIAIKQRLGKLNCRVAMPELAKFCEGEGFERLAIEPEHVERTKALPDIHKDPFDRLLIAQAQTENLVIITRDAQIPKYDVPTVW